MKNIKITDVEYLNDLILKISFSDGRIQEVNFRPFIEKALHPEISKYSNIKLFKQYELINGDLIWNDYDLIFPIWDLYSNTLSSNSKTDEEAS